MASVLERGRSRIDRLTSSAPVLPTALAALVGDELLTRGVDTARDLLQRSWTRGIRETRNTLRPMRKATMREIQKSRRLQGVVPFYPAIALVPLAVLAGVTVFSTIATVRASRRDRAIEARLDAIEAELASLKQAETAGAQPAAIPWS